MRIRPPQFTDDGPRLEGWDAYFDGWDCGDNPYRMGSWSFHMWEHGYYDAEEADAVSEYVKLQEREP